MGRQQLLSELALVNDRRIVLLVLDGVGDLRTEEQPSTPLEAARTPNLDRLARRSSLGRLVPTGIGITPGSGPGHLALFGHDPTTPECDIGRGVLEALGLGLTLSPDTLAARGNFASIDSAGNLTDRRAGRIPTEECRRLCRKLSAGLESTGALDLDVSIHAAEGYRFVLLVRGPDLSAALSDTDPQRLGVPPLALEAADPEAVTTAERLEPLIAGLRSVLNDEPRANDFLLRGFSRLPDLRPIGELYGVTAGAFAGYPLYRGVAAACGMEVIECGKQVEEIVAAAAARWTDFDFLFLHVKQTDMAGEDGRFDDKVAVIEQVDRALPSLLELAPDTLAITADHSTPVPMKSHSWHPVPLLVHSERCFVDDCTRFTELEAVAGVLATTPAHELMGLLLAHAGRLQKYGA